MKQADTRSQMMLGDCLPVLRMGREWGVQRAVRIYDAFELNS